MSFPRQYGEGAVGWEVRRGGEKGNDERLREESKQREKCGRAGIKDGEIWDDGKLEREKVGEPEEQGREDNQNDERQEESKQGYGKER